jgi:hypothetical protein
MGGFVTSPASSAHAGTPRRVPALRRCGVGCVWLAVRAASAGVRVGAAAVDQIAVRAVRVVPADLPFVRMVGRIDRWWWWWWSGRNGSVRAVGRGRCRYARWCRRGGSTSRTADHRSPGPSHSHGRDGDGSHTTPADLSAPSVPCDTAGVLRGLRRGQHVDEYRVVCLGLVGRRYAVLAHLPRLGLGRAGLSSSSNGSAESALRAL